jgi:23S rRNA pseudouridine1911/1915/1917 synthase
VRVIYEDSDMLVVHKPAGMLAHSDEHHLEGSLLQEVRKQYPEAELAHRLDKDTSGLLMVAKDHATYEYCKALFQKRAIRKTYKALVVGRVVKNEGVINLPIGRSTQDFRKRVASPVGGAGFREAETTWNIRERYEEYTLLEAHPKTGRTHQIRSHMASIGHPVACDKLYGGKRYKCPAGLTRQFLHASGLEFTARRGERIRLEVDMPEDLKNTLKTLKQSF